MGIEPIKKNGMLQLTDLKITIGEFILILIKNQKNKFLIKLHPKKNFQLIEKRRRKWMKKITMMMRMMMMEMMKQKMLHHKKKIRIKRNKHYNKEKIKIK